VLGFWTRAFKKGNEAYTGLRNVGDEADVPGLRVVSETNMGHGD